jgi:hypothetical protein
VFKGRWHKNVTAACGDAAGARGQMAPFADEMRDARLILFCNYALTILGASYGQLGDIDALPVAQTGYHNNVARAPAAGGAQQRLRAPRPPRDRHAGRPRR